MRWPWSKPMVPEPLRWCGCHCGGSLEWNLLTHHVHKFERDGGVVRRDVCDVNGVFRETVYARVAE